MCTAIDLIKRNKCKNFVIIEKSGGIGGMSFPYLMILDGEGKGDLIPEDSGTWHDNKYPGCCCDVWSQLYSYSFAQNPVRKRERERESRESHDLTWPPAPLPADAEKG